MPELPEIFTGSSVTEMVIGELLEINEESVNYNLTLSRDDISKLVAERNAVLLDTGRIEFRFETLTLIIEEFFKSPYINQFEYVQILNELQFVFYALKNETGGAFSDSKLIKMMSELFDGPCGGSLELLKGLGAEYILAIAGRKNAKLMNRAEKTSPINGSSYNTAEAALSAPYSPGEAVIIRKSLLVLIEELIYGYTRGKSFSISTEDAEKISRSILYAAELTGAHGFSDSDSLRTAYYDGLKIIDALVKNTLKLYKRVNETKLEIGLKEYNVSISAVAGFFKEYDKNYAAAEIPVDLSYFPALLNDRADGVSYINGWLRGILAENVICGLFESQSVERLLMSYRKKAEREARLSFARVNIFELVVTNGVIAALIGKPPSNIILSEDDISEVKKADISVIDKIVNYFLQYFDISDEGLSLYVSDFIQKRLKPKIDSVANVSEIAVFSVSEYNYEE